MSALNQQCRSLQQDPANVGGRSLPRIISPISAFLSRWDRVEVVTGGSVPLLHASLKRIGVVWVDRNTLLDFMQCTSGHRFVSSGQHVDELEQLANPPSPNSAAIQVSCVFLKVWDPCRGP